jgi:hypothetical protein
MANPCSCMIPRNFSGSKDPGRQEMETSATSESLRKGGSARGRSSSVDSGGGRSPWDQANAAALRCRMLRERHSESTEKVAGVIHLMSPSCRASMRRASLSVQPVVSIICTLNCGHASRLAMTEKAKRDEWGTGRRTSHIVGERSRVLHGRESCNECNSYLLLICLISSTNLQSSCTLSNFVSGPACSLEPIVQTRQRVECGALLLLRIRFPVLLVVVIGGGGGGGGVLGVLPAAPFQAEQPPLITSRVNTAVFQRQKQGVSPFEMGL